MRKFKSELQVNQVYLYADSNLPMLPGKADQNVTSEVTIQASVQPALDNIDACRHVIEHCVFITRHAERVITHCERYIALSARVITKSKFGEKQNRRAIAQSKRVAAQCMRVIAQCERTIVQSKRVVAQCKRVIGQSENAIAQVKFGRGRIKIGRRMYVSYIKGLHFDQFAENLHIGDLRHLKIADLRLPNMQTAILVYKQLIILKSI